MTIHDTCCRYTNCMVCSNTNPYCCECDLDINSLCYLSKNWIEPSVIEFLFAGILSHGPQEIRPREKQEITSENISNEDPHKTYYDSCDEDSDCECSPGCWNNHNIWFQGTWWKRYEYDAYLEQLEIDNEPDLYFSRQVLIKNKRDRVISKTKKRSFKSKSPRQRSQNLDFFFGQKYVK